jgi:hypothetical protein
MLSAQWDRAESEKTKKSETLLAILVTSCLTCTTSRAEHGINMYFKSHMMQHGRTEGRRALISANLLNY